jgi:polysaccharide deacetylase 2 family uncharacterized protein YibQ
MANSRRRKTARRSGRARPPIGAIVVALVVIAIIIYGVSVVSRQFKGYFGGAQHPRPVAVTTPNPAPQETETPQGTEISPTPTSPATQPSSGPRVAIIIDDCGYSEERCKQFLDLPIPITLSILPMTPHAKQIESDAQGAGKAVMLHLPMEPESPREHPGAGAITTEMSDDQVRAQVEADIDSVPDVRGANNHMGSKATSDPRIMRDVLQVFEQRHLFFIDSMTSDTTVGVPTARELGIPSAQRDVFLDNSKDLKYIQGQLKETQAVALKRGVAIAIGHPNETTQQALAEAIPTMQAAGITFVSAESLVK